jgi:hypothetical protein
MLLLKNGRVFCVLLNMDRLLTTLLQLIALQLLSPLPLLPWCSAARASAMPRVKARVDVTVEPWGDACCIDRGRFDVEKMAGQASFTKNIRPTRPAHTLVL